jgi:hypothetical protein
LPDGLLGEAKRPLNSYAKRLRRELFRAGVVRLTPIEVPAIPRGWRRDLGRAPSGTKLAPHPSDPLYFDTATTLAVDFHSFRRAFNTALAEAGVNVQHAMHLAAHSDPKTHMRYVMNTTAMRTIPEAALPQLLAGRLLESTGRDDSRRARDVSPSENEFATPGIVTARDDSTATDGSPQPRAPVTPRPHGAFSAPAAGLEPATRRLTAACSTN